MDDKTRDEMNRKIDVLFDQAEELTGEKRHLAIKAFEMWQSAKAQESLGMGPMETKSIYRTAYESIANLGLEVGGMIPPYVSPSSHLETIS